jgi:hypothetical protein
MLKQKPQQKTHHNFEIIHTSIISADETAAKEIPKITTLIAKQVTT